MTLSSISLWVVSFTDFDDDEDDDEPEDDDEDDEDDNNGAAVFLECFKITSWSCCSGIGEAFGVKFPGAIGA
jgi:hypothetical protein